MSNPTHESDPTNRDRTDWNVDYDIDPIRLRDPAAEALAVLEPGDPIVITYADVVKAAGHSCPTAAGAYRIAKAGLEASTPAMNSRSAATSRYSPAGRKTTPPTASPRACSRT